jgi:hypothetical protein
MRTTRQRAVAEIAGLDDRGYSPERMARPTATQQVVLWILAAILGLTLADLLQAGLLASIGLVAGTGILIGLVWAAWSARRPS